MAQSLTGDRPQPGRAGADFLPVLHSGIRCVLSQQGFTLTLAIAYAPGMAPPTMVVLFRWGLMELADKYLFGVGGGCFMSKPRWRGMQHTGLESPRGRLRRCSSPGLWCLQLVPQSSMSKATTTHMFFRGISDFLKLSIPSPVSFHLTSFPCRKAFFSSQLE